MSKKTYILFGVVLLSLILFGGCSGKEAPAEIIHFSNDAGDFEISASSDFEYHSGNTVNDMLALGKKDETAVVIVLQFHKSDYIFDDLTAFSTFCEEVALDNDMGVMETDGEAIYYEDYAAEGAEDAILKSLPIRSGNNEGTLLLGYLEYPAKYYFIQVYYLLNPKGGVPEEILDIPYSFREGRNAVDSSPVIRLDLDETTFLDENGRFMFIYRQTWTLAALDTGEQILQAPEGNATVMAMAMAEDIGETTLEEYMEIAMEELPALYENYDRVETMYTIKPQRRDGVLITDEPVYCSLVFDYTDDSGEIRRCRQTVWISEDMVYILSYYSTPEEYFRFLSNVKDMEESFQILY